MTFIILHSFSIFRCKFHEVKVPVLSGCGPGLKIFREPFSFITCKSKNKWESLAFWPGWTVAISLGTFSNISTTRILDICESCSFLSPLSSYFHSAKITALWKNPSFVKECTSVSPGATFFFSSHNGFTLVLELLANLIFHAIFLHALLMYHIVIVGQAHIGIEHHLVAGGEVISW